MRALYHPHTENLSLESVLYAFSDPIRLEILRKLALGSELSCGALEIEMPKSTASHHFKVLREAGVIRTRINGTQRFMSLRYQDLEDRFPGLLQAVLSAAQRQISSAP